MFAQIMTSYCLSAVLELIQKCIWFAHVNSLEGKVCAHAQHTHAHVHTLTYKRIRIYTTVILI